MAGFKTEEERRRSKNIWMIAAVIEAVALIGSFFTGIATAIITALSDSVELFGGGGVVILVCSLVFLAVIVFARATHEE